MPFIIRIASEGFDLFNKIDFIAENRDFSDRTTYKPGNYCYCR